MPSRSTTQSRPPQSAPPSRDVAACVCFNLRKAARAVTQLFDSALDPAGIKGTQFTVLVGVSVREPAPVGQLAKGLVMDRTTLTRNLCPLVKLGMVRIEPGSDRRSRMVRLTAKGRRTLEKAMPLWAGAQQHMVDGIGDKNWEGALSMLDRSVAVAQGHEGERSKESIKPAR